jgi:hypothetical protein
VSAPACSSATPHPPPAAERGTVLSGIVSGRCTEEGARATCSSETGTDEGIVNCFVGTQTCHDGAWGECLATGSATGGGLGADGAAGNGCEDETGKGSCEMDGGAPPTPSQTATYKMACKPGFRAVWNQFGYSTKVPGDSEVTFTATTFPELPDGSAGAPRAPVTLAKVKGSGGTDPAVCMGSSTGCPKNLFTILGPSAKYDPTMTLSLSTTGTTALPTVDSWTITYNCVPVNVE